MILRHIQHRQRPPSKRSSNSKIVIKHPEEQVTERDWDSFRDVDSDDEYTVKEERYFERLKRSVSFSPTVQVCLVPSRSDIGPRVKELFWKCEDYEQFKHEAIGEIRAYWKFSGTMSRDALTVLYQPEYDWPEDFFAPYRDDFEENENDENVEIESQRKNHYFDYEDTHAALVSVSPAKSSDIPVPLRHVDSLNCCRTDLDAETDSESLTDSLLSTRLFDSESDAESVASECLDDSD